MKASAILSRCLFAVATAMGVVAFFFPFFLSQVTRVGEGFSHASDAPALFAALAPILILVAVAEVRAGRLDSKQVALLGILGGINAVLRLPTGLAGAKLIYVLPILCGYAYGPGFGFLLGAGSMGVSALVTGGVGPWVPFEMWALGWVGAGAGLLRPVLRRLPERGAVVSLAAYGWIGGFAYGALMNLWFWPYLGTLSDSLSWRPGLGLGPAVQHYWRFYLATSMYWDSAAAVANLALILALGRPVLRLLIKFRRRFAVASFSDPDAEPGPISPAPARV